MLLLNKSISKDCFNNLIEECFNVADTFSLTKGPDLYPEGKALLEQLNPYFVKTIETQHWFSYYVPAPYKKKIYIFKACDESKNAILESYPGLFMDELTQWTTLEDLCFFIDKKLLLGTVSHEYICYCYPPTDDINKHFKKICNWKKTDDDLNELISYE